ncbi:hypothetical protein N7471_004023 [Penicillium samsonianum]|uniref:uncharacterized protein n=1 Tax=Penicillium samsonianum TaxID=1882272 RepID=UPI002547430A|nr:uncharacterized protein N7471_004023 [Penicillium samsonianum]KAJ6137537.1 hypothetical protein N7471_004023 [Penicillium samsonianum]
MAPSTGFRALINTTIDVKLLCLQRLVRLYAFGISSLILALHLAKLGFSEERIGLFMTLTLLGDVFLSLVVTAIADRIGRARMLALGSLLMASSGVIFAISNNYWVLLLASIFGVISPSGGDIGPFKAIEESMMAQLVTAADFNAVLAWYYLLGAWGTAAGVMGTGWVIQVLEHRGLSTLVAYKCMFCMYSLMGVIKLILSVVLSKACEMKAEKDTTNAERDPPIATEAQPLLPKPEPERDINNWITRLCPTLCKESKKFLTKFCFIISLDSFGSGLASNSWLTYFLTLKYDMQLGFLGSIFFASNLLASVSNLIAIPVAHKVGLIATMVLGHVPASIALLLLPLLPTVFGTVTCLLIRSIFIEFDQAPRQAFLAHAILPEERTVVMGGVNVVRTLSRSFAPFITGVLGGRDGKGGYKGIGLAISLAGCLKLAYNVLLLGAFGVQG